MANYGFRHRLVSFVSSRFFDHATYTVRHGLLRGMRRRGGLAWLPSAFAPAPNAETRFWAACDFSDMVVWDVGAFHGLLSLHFARSAKQVVSFEPNPASHKRCLENLELNRCSNVDLRRVGVGAKKEKRILLLNPRLPGTALLDPQLDSAASHSPGAHAEEIEVTTVDDEVAAGAPAPSFIKIDVEGFELEVLTGATSTLQIHRPRLFLEMHGVDAAEKRLKVDAIVKFLTRADYDSLHVESGNVITIRNSEIAMEGHLYCEPVLC